MFKNTLAILLTSLTTTFVSAETVTHFSAELNASSVIKSGSAASNSPLTGTATFTLTEPVGGEATLSYRISLPGADLDKSETPAVLSDNITGIHIHDVNIGAPNNPAYQSGDTAGTKHVLNVFGMPRTDDSDLVVDVANDLVTGLWDEYDKNNLMPAPSGKPSESLTELLAGDLFLMVHTQTGPGGAFGGYLQRVPEPTAGVMLLIGQAMLFTRRRAA